MTAFLVLVGLGLLFGVPIALVVLFGKFRQMEYRLRVLENELRKLHGQSVAGDIAGSQTPQERQSAQLPAAQAFDAPRSSVQTPAPPPLRATQLTTTATLRSFDEPTTPSRTRQEWEALVGSKLLNRIGALALILGVGFFLKYAFDNNWITETARVLMGGALGIGLLVLGGLSHRRGLAIFSQGILGAGIAILYLSVYASFNFYHLVSHPVAFGMMAAVTALAFWQGLRYDSLAIALLGWIGGYLTPFLLETDSPNAVGLFTYLSILTAGVLAVISRKKSWILLHGMSLLATYVTYFVWSAEYSGTVAWPIVLIYLSFWLLVFLASELFAQIRPGTMRDLLQVASVLNLLLYIAALRLLFNAPTEDTTKGIVELLAAVLYGGLHVYLSTRSAGDIRLRHQYAIFAVVLLALASLDFLDGYWMVMAWTLEALGLFWLGRRRELRPLWATALCLLAVAAIALLLQKDSLQWQDVAGFHLLLNQRALTIVVLALSLGVTSWLASRRLHGQSDRLIAAFLTIAWTAALFYLLTVETTDYFRQRMFYTTGHEQVAPEFLRTLTLCAVWAIYSLPLVWMARLRQNIPLSGVGVVSVGLAALASLFFAFSYHPIEQFHLFVNFRFVSALVVIVSLTISARLFAHWGDGSAIARLLSAGLSLAALGCLLILFTAETWNQFDRMQYDAAHAAADATVLARLADLQQLTLSGVWLLFSVALMALGLWRRIRLLRVVAMVLFGITILKIFIYDLSFLESLYRIFSFIGLGVILLTVSYLYQRYKGIILEEGDRPAA